MTLWGLIIDLYCTISGLKMYFNVVILLLYNNDLADKADKTQLPQRISDTFSPTIIAGNVSNAICWVYVFGYVETVVINFTLSASVPAGTELLSLLNVVSQPKGFIPINFVRFSAYETYEGYVNGSVNKIIALEALPADTYEFIYTYVV